jgi:phage-related minor tail protein
VALELGTLVAFIKADDSQLTSGLSKARTKVGAFGKGIGTALKGAGIAAGALLAAGVAKNLDIGAGRAKLAAQLDLTAQDSERIGAVAGAVYADNWGSSLDEVNEAVRAVGQNLGDVTEMSSAELQQMTQSALALSNTFDVDLAQATEAAGKMVKNGLAKNSQEAFDILAKGFQNGLDRSGDFLETMNEYSPQFAKLGIDGGMALAILDKGLQAGIRDTDVITDAFKEFSIRAIDGSKTTSDAYKSLGLDAKDTARTIAEGGPAAAAMTEQVIAALANIKDPLEQDRIGVELFGSQWEDTLRQALPAMTGFTSGTADIEGAMQRVSDTAGGSAKGKIESLRRSFEMWTADMASSSSGLGTVVTGVLAFGGPALAMAGTLGQVAAGLAAVNLTATVTAVKTAAVAAATGVWTAAQWLLNTAIYANPIGLIVLAIIALVAIIVVAWKNSETFRTVVTAAWNGIKTAGLAVFGWLKTYVPAVFNAVKSVVVSILSAIVSQVRADINRVRAVVRGVIAVVTFFRNAFNKAKSVVGSMLGAIVGQVRADVGRVLAVVRGVIAVATFFGNAFNRARSAVASRVSAIISTVRTVPGRIRGAIGNLGGLLIGAGRSVIDGFIRGITAGFDRVRGTLGHLTSMIPSWKGPVEVDDKLLVDNGKRVIRSFVDGLRASRPAVRDELQGLTRAIPDMPHPVSTLPTQRTASTYAAPADARRDGGSRRGAAEIKLKGSREMIALFRSMVADFGGGSVEEALGT